MIVIISKKNPLKEFGSLVGASPAEGNSAASVTVVVQDLET